MDIKLAPYDERKISAIVSPYFGVFAVGTFSSPMVGINETYLITDIKLYTEQVDGIQTDPTWIAIFANGQIVFRMPMRDVMIYYSATQ